MCIVKVQVYIELYFILKFNKLKSRITISSRINCIFYNKNYYYYYKMIIRLILSYITINIIYEYGRVSLVNRIKILKQTLGYQ